MERELFKSYQRIIGCDEVGRGPLAGPVVGGAVSLDDNSSTLVKLESLGVTDSKKLTDKKRNKILVELGISISNVKLEEIHKVPKTNISFVLFEHTHSEIDEMNILQASLSAMKNASDKLILGESKQIILIDGNKDFDSVVQTMPVIKGDSKSLAIGLASIIAKVFRDEKMKHYDELYPGYSFGKHAGYPTKEHKHAIASIGPSKIHRKTFKGVKEFF